MNRKQLILKQLKTKARAFGFSKKELESVAEAISNNLDLEDDASDEDVNAEIETAVDAVLPFLKVSQSAANRAIQAFRAAHPVDGNGDGNEGNDGNGDDDDDPANQDPDASKKGQKKGKKAQTTANDDDTPAWAKSLLDANKALQDRLDKIEGANTADKRQSQLEKLLKDTGSFGKRTMNAFKRMKFKDDEEFEEFLEEVQSDLEELNQERANDGLSKLGSVPNTKGKKKSDEDNEVEPMNEDELTELANGF